MIRTLLGLVALALTMGLALDPALAQDKKEGPDEKKMMEAWMKHGTPGEHHKVLEKLTGSWTYTGQFIMGPDKVVPIKGTAERKMILDGRFLQDHVKGDNSGMPFEGYGMIGYDNATKKYVGSWADSMTTSLSTLEGTYDEKTKTLTAISDTYDPFTKKVTKSRDVTRLISNDEVETNFFNLVDGKEVKMMTINYKRKK